MKKTLAINGQVVDILVNRLDAQEISFEMEGRRFTYEVLSGGRLRQKGRNCSFFYGAGHAVVAGRDVFIQEARGQGGFRNEMAGQSALSAMPGKVLKVLVAQGDQVNRGDALVVLEAMKMEHTLKAARKGVVQSIRCQEGERIEAGVELVKVGDGPV